MALKSGLTMATPCVVSIWAVRFTGSQAGILPSFRPKKSSLSCLPGLTAEMIPDVVSRLSPEQIDIMSSNPPQVGNFFPNGLFEFIYLPTADGKVTGAMALHTYVPMGRISSCS